MIDLFYLFLLSMGFNVLAVIVYSFCPMCIKLAVARLRGDTLVIRLNKSGTVSILTGSKTLELITTKDGLFEYEPEDMFSFNGCRAGLWYESYNTGANAKVLTYITNLKKRGFDTVGKFNAFVNATEAEITERFPGEAVDILTMQKEIKEDAYILSHVECVRLRDLQNYLKARNPAAIKGIVEREVYKERQKNRNFLIDNWPFVLGGAVIIFALAVGYKMISTGDTSGAAEVVQTATGSAMALK